MPVRITCLRVIIGALALLLMAILGFGPVALVKDVYAKSDCNVILLCSSPTPLPIPLLTPISVPMPTPTLGLIPGPTPTSSPTPGLISTPSQASGSNSTASSKATGNASPSMTPTRIAHTPVASPTSIPPLMEWNDKIQPLGQFGSSGFAHMMVIAVVIFLFLLFGLGIGLFVFRRTLLPSINVKVPSSSTDS